MTGTTSCATQRGVGVQSENATTDRRSVFIFAESYAAPDTMQTPTAPYKNGARGARQGRASQTSRGQPCDLFRLRSGQACERHLTHANAGGIGAQGRRRVSV